MIQSILLSTLALHVTCTPIVEEDICVSTKPIIQQDEEKATTTAIFASVFIIIVGITVGNTITLSQLTATIKASPRPFAVGLLCQFICMPFFGFLLSFILPQQDAFCNKSSLALAALLPGCMPGGTTSNLFTKFLGGNMELSVAMSFVSGAAAAFTIPFNLAIYYESRFGHDTVAVKVPYDSIFLPLVLSLSGVFVGMLVTRCASQKVSKIVDRVGSIIAALFLIILLFWGIITNSGVLKNSTASFFSDSDALPACRGCCGFALGEVTVSHQHEEQHYDWLRDRRPEFHTGSCNSKIWA